MARTKKTTEAVENTAAATETTATTAAEATETAPKKHRRYFGAMVGMSGDIPYAFHLEGALTRKPNMMPPKEDKAEMAIVSMGIGMDRDELLARAKHEEFTKKAENEQVTFVTLAFYGQMAKSICSEENLKEKGQLISVCGALSTFKNKDGNMEVEVTVDNYVLMGNDATRNKRISVAPNTYTDKEGIVQTNQMASLITGNVINDPELKISQNGNPFLRIALGLAVPAKKVYDIASTGKVGTYEKDDDTVLTLFYFGKDAEVKARLIQKGARLAVTGTVRENPYNGNISYKMMPFATSILKFADRPAADGTAPAAAAAPAKSAPAASQTDDFADLGDEDDFDLPF